MRATPHCLRKLSSDIKIVSGNVGDHSLIASLLAQVALAPRAEDFQSRNDAPSYLPADRLLVKRKGQLIGHVHLSRSIGWFQGVRLPLVKLNDFAMLPEYLRQTADGTQYAAALLQEAESTAAREGAMLAVQHTDQSEWFQQQGWSLCRVQGHTLANTRAILSHLDAQQSLRRRRAGINEAKIEIRSWRHVELDCLRHIYQQSVIDMWGTLHRSEETWQWLAGRKAHDQILLAIDRSAASARSRSRDDPLPPAVDPPDADEVNGSADGPDESVDSAQDPPGGMTSICTPQEAIGYAVLRDSCLIEMFTLPGFSSARTAMIAQACRDAIDRDHHFVELHTPAVDPMHELLVTAGGSWQRRLTADGEWMFKLLSPDKWLERLYPVLQQRTHEGGLARPLEITLDVDGLIYQLTLTRRSARLQPVSASNCAHSTGQVACDRLAFQDLLTSNLKVSTAIAQGRLATATPDISQTLAILFPFRLFWQSPFELLRL
jgi:hypothetical protein